MCDVLVVGAGPVGLTAGVLFERLGVNAILVDRLKRHNRHPKARSLNVRSVEIFRALGIEPAIRKWDFPREARRIMWLESFCGEELAKISLDTGLVTRYSPCEPAFLSQARLEDLLRDSIKEEHVTIQYGTEFIDFVEENDSIVATLQKETGETFQVRAKYLLAADGARSSVRKRSEIPVIGREDLGKFVSIYFKADPYPIAPYRPSGMYFMLGDASFGRFIHSVNCKDEWLMGIKLCPEMEKDDTDFHKEYCLQFIRETFEIPDLKIEILDIEFWNMRVQIAENFRKGRLFLAGDAAHLLSPAGGFGMQTGIQDVHNLCWKLASVIQSYQSSLVVPDGTNALAITAAEYLPNARPGSRAPHLWLQGPDGVISTIDLFVDSFTLLTDSDGESWTKVLRGMNPTLSFRCVSIGELGDYNDINADFHELYGIERGGAVLVRPDGHVYWRSVNPA
jgi:putative polyketide hydroxylase